MLNGKTFLALIPARKGSKRLPKKNKMLMAGKPLISWSIESALSSKLLDQVVVSTDDPEIAQISNGYDGVLTLMRPDYLGGDNTPTFEVLEHAVSELSLSHHLNYDYLVLLQATSPLRRPEHIDLAIQLMVESSSDGLISISKSKDIGLLVNLQGRHIQKFDEQNLPSNLYKINGLIYIANISKMLAMKKIFLPENVHGYITSDEVSIDIDNLYEFKFAESIIKSLNE